MPKNKNNHTKDNNTNEDEVILVNKKNQQNNANIEKKILLPKNDVVFSTLFSAKHKNLVKSLISSILKEKITDLDMDKSTHLIRNYIDDKLGVLDLRVKLNNEIYCNVEVQMHDYKNMTPRMLFYWAKLFQSQLNVGGLYQNLGRTISVAILNFELDNLRDMPDYCNEWVIMDKKEGKVILTDLFKLIIIELPKLAKYSTDEIKHDQLAQWMLFIDNPESSEVKEIMESNSDIKQAVKTLEEISDDKEMRRLVELREKAILDEASLTYDAKQEGLKEGAKHQKIEIAKKMLENKMDIETIAKLTGLTKEEIKNLK